MEAYPLLLDVSAWVLPVLLAVTLHEAAHGWVAERFGDPTARSMGRVTFNPLKHVDPLGTVALPGLLLAAGSPVVFGYAKPVPVDFNRLRPRRLGELCVAAAGPGINILLALLSALALHVESFVTPEQAPWLFMNLYRLLILNCVLAVFNLLPILPLDGGRVLHALLPDALRPAWGKTERFGMAVVIGLLFLPGLIGMDFVGTVVGGGSGWLVEQILDASGNAARYQD